MANSTLITAHARNLRIVDISRADVRSGERAFVAADSFAKKKALAPMSLLDVRLANEDEMNGEGDYDDDDDENAGAIIWEEDDVEASEGNLAQAALSALSAREVKYAERKRVSASGRVFDEFKKLFAGAELPEPEHEHSVIAVRDAGIHALQPHERESMNVDTERGKRTAQTVIAQHILMAPVSDEFLRGEMPEREATIATMDPETGGPSQTRFVQILPPRVPKHLLPAGEKLEKPIVRLITDTGALVKQTTVSSTFKLPQSLHQTFLVVGEPLAKWAKPKTATK
jgi:hypothetical protein